MSVLLELERQYWTFFVILERLTALLVTLPAFRLNPCMDSKDSGEMPPSGTAGVISGAGSVSVLPQRNGATSSEMCPSPVSRTFSSGSEPSSALPTRNGDTPDEVHSTPSSRTLSSGSGTDEVPMSALPQRNGGSTTELFPASLSKTSPLVVHTPAAATLDSGTPGSTGLFGDRSSTPSNLGPLHECNMSTAIVPHLASASMGGVVNTGKRKRGRPRKYATDGSTAFASTPSAAAPRSFSPSGKRGRGRPPGSGKKQQLAALGDLMIASAGAGFTPHAITIAAGEDVATKIMSFSQQGPRAICILSANGAISNVTLQQSATSGGTVTYEGRFEILSLSGSFLLTESGGGRTRTGGLSVSLAGPDGRVVGGGVAGLLVAASPVQVIVGSFVSNTRKPQARPNCSGVVPEASASRSPSNDILVGRSSEDKMLDVKPVVPDCSPLSQFAGAITSNNATPYGQPILIPIVWSASQLMPEVRRISGIDISLPGV